jgi:predicted NAD/FAD-binding protein
LHTDASVMPRRRMAWASWNYRIEAAPNGPYRASTHYWMNALQNVSKRRNYFVSLNCRDRVRPETVLYETEYEHPIFTRETMRAQAELGSLNRGSPRQRVYFCGSYFRYGFHEDAYWSALEACKAVREHLAA